MRVKLTELLGTKYLYLTFCNDVRYICESIKSLQKDADFVPNAFNDATAELYQKIKLGTPIELDLAGAKLTSDMCDTILLQQRSGTIFVDSENSWRDAILQENRKRLDTHLENTETMPEFTQEMRAPDYIRNLKKDIIYVPPVIQENVYLPLVVLTTITRPTIQFSIDVMSRGLFNYVGSHLTLRQLKSYHEFFYVTSEGVQIVDFDYPVYVQGFGYGEIADALKFGYLVPTIFGKEKLVSNPDFLQMFKDCNDAIDKYRNSRKQTLEEVLL